MSNTIKILFLGATGNIGGSFVDSLLKHPRADEFEIAAFVRSAEKAEELEKFGLKAVTGSLEDAASNAAVIINCAASGNIPVTDSILTGAKKHYTSTNVPTIFIHTSGSSIVADNALGKYASEKVFDDLDTETLNALPVTQTHRNTDIPILKAHNQGYLKAYIVAPAVVYGLATGKLVDAGLQKPNMAITIMSTAAIARGTFGMVNQQLNVRSTVEIHDLTDLYMLIFNAVTEGKDIPGGYYFAANGDVVARDYLTKMAEALHEFGLLKTAETSVFTQEEMEKMPAFRAFGVNARVTASRARSIGWKPTHTPEDFLKGIRASVEVLTKQKQEAGTAAVKAHT